MTLNPNQVEWCRRQFPALSRRVGDHTAAYFDGPGGTQTPQRVIDAVSHCLAHTNANHEGKFAASRESDAMLAEAHRTFADFLGAADADEVVFGQNMTSLTFAISRALARTWQPGDEVLVTKLDHDANIAPWELAARDAGATVRYAEIHKTDATLDLDDLRSKLNENTRLVAVGCASNSTGSINPVREICMWAREAGALSYLDAVHFAPHEPIDVVDFGCDFLACSAYKFFGPHVGVLWGRRELLESLEAYKVRPAPKEPPGKWMTGTQNHEGIAGAAAAVEYLADLGRELTEADGLDRRAALAAAFEHIREYEQSLARRLLKGLAAIDGVTVYGIDDLARLDERVPTVSFTLAGTHSADLALSLGDQGFFVWDGNYYAVRLSETLGLEPHGMLRVGIVHYNTAAEVDRLLQAIDKER